MSRRSPGIGDLLDAAFCGYRRFWTPCLVSYLIFLLPYILLRRLWFVLATTGIHQGWLREAARLVASLTPWAYVSFGAVLAGLAEGICACIVLHDFQGKPVSTRSVFTALRGSWSRLLGMGFAKLLLIGLGFVACLIPGIVMAINYAVAVPGLVGEDLTIKAALRRSNELVADSRGRTFGLLFLLWLFSFLANLVSTTVFLGAGAVAEHTGILLGPLSAAQEWINLVVEAVVRLLVPLGGLLWAYHYLDLRSRKEGFDLTVAAERLDIGGPPAGQRGIGNGV